MPDGKPDSLDRSRLRQMALSRWESEGGAGPDRAQVRAAADEVQCETPQLTLTDLAQLRIRVIALENLVITLLAEASESQIERVREMAAYISPRPGFTPHPLTSHAAALMIDLVERASHFRS